MIVEIKNSFISLKISTLGAEMKSIKTSDGKEHLHLPDKLWEDQAPVLFPICGYPVGDKITVDGKDYPMKPHGFAMFSEFDIAEQTETSVTFVLKSSTETRLSYPYDFEFYVIYTLCGSSIDIKYKVINKNSSKMYFSVGSHDGHYCPGGLSYYEIHFEKTESKKPIIYETGLVPEDSLAECDGHSVLTLSDKLFDDSITVVYTNVDSNFVILKNTKTAEETKITYDGCENLLIWTEPFSDFVCIEPWCGMADYGKTHDDISAKLGIHFLEENGIFEINRVITFC